MQLHRKATNTGRVSVVMAAYNGARWLEEQLLSIANQSVAPFELIVSDDGSTDGTVDLVQRFAAAASFPVRLDTRAVRLGFADNFLTAAAVACGDLVAFADQDDVWLPTKLEQMCAPFEDPATELVLCDSVMTDERLAPGRPVVRTGLVTRFRNGGPWEGQRGNCMLLRSSLLRIFDPFDRPLSIDGNQLGHDGYAYFLAQSFGKIVHLRKALVLYRRHADTATEAVTPPRRAWLRPPSRDELTGQAIAMRSRLAHLERPPLVLLDSRREAALSQARRRYHRYARNYAWRMQLHEYRPVRLAGHLVGGVLAGTYAGQGTGGLGWLSLLQDAHAACAPPCHR